MTGYSVLFYVLSALTAAVIVLAVLKKDLKYCLLAAITSYVLSFIGSWSVGKYTLSLTFALLALFFAGTMKLIKKPQHAAAVVCLAFIAWVISIITVDDLWLFFPINIIFNVLGLS